MRSSGGITLVVALALAPALAAGQEGVPRPAIESLEAQLEHAVARVSVPHAAVLLGRAEATRGYRLPGYGVVFVLTARALPGEGAVFALRGGHRLRPRIGIRPPPPPRAPAEDSEVEAVERQVLVLQREAERMRREAEEDMERIVADVRILLVPDSPSAESPSPAPGVPPPAPAPGAEVPPVFDVPVAPPPPWMYWFETGSREDERTAERIVADVRAAVLDSLEREGAHVAGLGADEFVTVAVDFIPGGILAPRTRPSRTLVVRARQRDLAARTRGALAPEEFRRRVEVVEY